MTLQTEYTNAPSGPISGVTELLNPFNYAQMNIGEVVENPQAWPSLAASDGVTATHSLDSQLMTSHTRVTADGQFVLALANLAAVIQPADSFNLIAEAYKATLRQGPSGEIGGGGVLKIDAPVVAVNARESIFTLTAVPELPTFDDGSMVIASPVNALPAGIAYTNAKSDDGNGVEIGYANLGAAIANLGIIEWSVCVIIVPELVIAAGGPVDGPHSAPSGPARISRTTVTLDHPSLPAALVTEAAVPVPGLVPGDVVSVHPTAALPAGVALSHGRCQTAGEALIGLGNITAGAIDPVAQTYDLIIAAL